MACEGYQYAPGEGRLARSGSPLKIAGRDWFSEALLD